MVLFVDVIAVAVASQHDRDIYNPYMLGEPGIS